MNTRIAAIAFLLLPALLAAQRVAANEVGFYMGGAYGLVSKEGDRASFEDANLGVYEAFDYTPLDFNSSFDEEDSTFELLVGYRLTPHLAFEGSYTRLGELTYRSRSRGVFPNDTGTLDVNIASETSGFEVSVLGLLPVNYSWELFARAGALFATNRLKFDLAVQGDLFVAPGGSRIRDEFSKSSTDWLAGVGATLRFLDIYDLRLEYQRVFDAGLEETGGVGDIEVLSLGVIVTF